MASKYNELQHKMANDMIEAFKEYSQAEKEFKTDIRAEYKLDNASDKIRFILEYLDTKVIKNNKLTNVHAYVQCLKQFKNG